MVTIIRCIDILLPMQRAAIFMGLLVPVMAMALTLEDQTEKYTDAPFNSAVTAGVSVLTEVGAVEGNPDGTFRPDRLLNRAEFLKIVLASHSDTVIDLENGEAGCFPDVGRWDWFSPYVCYAKEHGIVGGYPDGYFRPENSVNNAEALKMLGELYGVADDRWEDEGERWYIRYREAAYAAGVGLPGLEQNMEHLLTRGEMARLAAAYLAHAEGRLEEYRAMERGQQVSSVSSDSLVSSSSSSSSSIATRLLHPAQSHFLVVGSRTLPLASGVFQFSSPSDIRSVTVKMKKELRTLAALHLVDAQGRTLVTLKPDNTDVNDRRWKGEAAAGISTVGPGTIPLGLEATIKTPAQGGFPEEFVEVKSMSMIVGDTAGTQTFQVLPLEWAHPPHQTALRIVDRVENAGPAKGTLTFGANQRLAEFRFIAQSTGATVTMENIVLTPLISGGISVEDWRIRRNMGGEAMPCSFGTDGFLTCPIPGDLGTITGGALVFVILGDTTMIPGTQGATLQLLLDAPGSTSSLGAVHWSDGTGHYRWMEGEAPLARGTGWQ